MKHSNISAIKASLPNVKKSKFNLSHDNNTTYDWGSVQPLMSKLMLPDSSININMEQLTRLAPMVVPTFGRVKLKNVAHFVPCAEIFPNWDGMMSQTKVTRSTSSNGASVNSYVPKNVPFVNNNVLAAFCLAGAKVNLYWSGLVANGEEARWFCTNNQSPNYASPTPNASMTTAARALLYQILDIKDNATPSTVTLSDWNYTGYDYYVRRLVRKQNGGAVFNSSGTGGGNVLHIPTISTMKPQPLDNANGTGFTHSADNENQITAAGTNANLGPVTFDGADMIWEYAGAAGAGITSAERAVTDDSSPVAGLANNSFDGRKIRLVFKLSSFGKRLRKILIGLGYDVNLANDDKVSILPLVAFYKAWWDTYAPERYKNFYETAAWKLINASMVNAQCCDLVTIMNGNTGSNMRSFFVQFMVDLGCCFATERVDAISAATDNYYAGSNTTQGVGSTTDIQMSVISQINEVLQYTLTNYSADGSLNMMPTTAGGSNTPSEENGIALWLNKVSGTNELLTQPQIDQLKKAYVMLNKASVAGMKVEEILRALGFGDYVEECKGKFINANDNSIKISDVVATAATSDAKLGQYGGRGIGIGNFQFSFKTNRYGYMIILSSIVPEAGYVNAPVHENEAISFQTMYNPEFDGLAYEAIQKKNLAGSPLINDATYADTFGFLPTYSQWKFMSNKANGDFSLNSMKNSLMPYTLDKYIPVGDANVYSSHIISGGTNDGTTEIDCAPSFTYADLPNAGEDYRYVNKFPWNGNYNRIFADVDDGYEWSVFSKNNNQFLYNSFEYDNFLVHNVFDIAYWAPMKSIEESYGTYDEEHGAPNTSISRS